MRVSFNACSGGAYPDMMGVSFKDVVARNRAKVLSKIKPVKAAPKKTSPLVSVGKVQEMIQRVKAQPPSAKMKIAQSVLSSKLRQAQLKEAAEKKRQAAILAAKKKKEAIDKRIYDAVIKAKERKAAAAKAIKQKQQATKKKIAEKVIAQKEKRMENLQKRILKAAEQQQAPEQLEPIEQLEPGQQEQQGGIGKLLPWAAAAAAFVPFFI